MLTTAQRTQLMQVIIDHIGLVPQRRDIAELLGPEAVNGLPAGANGAGIAKWVLDVALRSPTPACFVHVVATADSAGQLGEVHALVQQLRADPSLWQVQVLDELWVPARFPFMDRRQLRDRVTEMAAGHGPAAITIEAPTGHGKRTMCAYIELVAARRGTFMISQTQIQDTPEAEQLAYLVESLRLAMGVGPATDTTHEEIEREATMQALALARDALVAPQPAWLVVNVMQAAGFGDGLRRFVDDLLEHVQTKRAVAAKLRVVLVADAVGALQLQHLPPPEARFLLPEVTQEWVREWFEATTPGRDPEVYDLFTATVLQKLELRRPPPTPATRLRWLALSCAQAQLHLAAVPGG